MACSSDNGGVSCPECGSQSLYRVGISRNGGHQRYRCRSCKRNFQTQYVLSGFIPGIDKQVLALHFSGATQTRIRHELGLSFNTIRAIIRGHPRGNPFPPCPHCQGENISRFGRDGEAQRYLCKDCKKTYIER